jgi:hypothetical protein
MKVHPSTLQKVSSLSKASGYNFWLTASLQAGEAEFLFHTFLPSAYRSFDTVAQVVFPMLICLHIIPIELCNQQHPNQPSQHCWTLPKICSLQNQKLPGPTMLNSKGPTLYTFTIYSMRNKLHPRMTDSRYWSRNLISSRPFNFQTVLSNPTLQKRKSPENVRCKLNC